MAPISVGPLTGVLDLIPVETGTTAEHMCSLNEDLFVLRKCVVGGFGALALSAVVRWGFEG